VSRGTIRRKNLTMAIIRKSQQAPVSARMNRGTAVGLLLLPALVLTGCGRIAGKSYPRAQLSGTAEPSAAGTEIRSEYPLSLISGGVTSDVELEAARAADPVLADHYAEVGFLQPASLSRDQWLYASYRQGRSIVWTNSRIRVRAGEVVMADRSGNLVRGRCGNRLSDTPRLPVAFVQPPEATVEIPDISFVAPLVLPNLSRDGFAYIPFPPFPALAGPTTRAFIGSEGPTAVRKAEWSEEGRSDRSLSDGQLLPPLVSINPAFVPVMARPVVTPEPRSTWLLVAGGIFLMACDWRSRYRLVSRSARALALSLRVSSRVRR
jgi:hypothetical protein